MSDQPLGYRLMLSLVLPMACLTSTEAHRSRCHRWHSCPSDRGTYTCGDLGYCRIVAIPHENITRFSICEACHTRQRVRKGRRQKGVIGNLLAQAAKEYLLK